MGKENVGLKGEEAEEFNGLEFEKVGDNINMAIASTGKMYLEVDLNKTIGPASSGKSIVIASTRGNKSIEAVTGSRMGLNFWRKARNKEEQALCEEAKGLAGTKASTESTYTGTKY